MTFVAIRPRGFTVPEKAIVAAELDRLGRQVEADMKQYPAWTPWKSRPPKTGRRAGGRRTGDLGRSWGYKVTTGRAVELRVESDTGKLERPYNRYVQGKKQTKVMRGRGWRKVSTLFAVRQRETKRRLALWAKIKVR